MSRSARRGAVLAALVIILLVAGAAGAAAHPLGNFTVNTSSGLRVEPERLNLDYVVDLAEIPAFQARQAIDADHDGRVGGAEADRWRDRECPRLAAGLTATVDGRAVRLAVTGSALTFPEGVGGLPTLRLACALTAPLPAAGRTLTFRDGNHQGRVGWREITAVGDRVTLDATDVPPTSPSARLTSYPEDQLSSPLVQRTATLRYHPGGPPASADAPGSTSSGRGVDRATAAFAALVGERSGSAGFAVVALVVALGLGAAHALAPGHGKTVMAAYLVGMRGSLRQAATIGATVTLTHTAGVLLLGLVLSTTRAVASERVYPWLGLGSGLLLTGVGVGLLLRARSGNRHHHHAHDHVHHGQDHDHHGPDHDLPRQDHDRQRQDPAHHGHDHDLHGQHGTAGRPLSRRGLVALGLAGGLVPSPSAVVVLLAGIALGRAWFGVALVLAYGLGMAATLTGIGLLLAQLRTRMDRRLQLPAGSLLTRLGRLLPAATASVIVLVGLGLALQGAARL
jgi:ABC-type nickel/cobalt efflux system permease component RcnA